MLTHPKWQGHISDVQFWNCQPLWDFAAGRGWGRGGRGDEKKEKSLGVGMSCVVDLCNWQRVSMGSTRASRCLSGLQRVSGLLIGVWTIYTSYLYICMSLCPRMTAPAEREKLRRSAWLGAERPHVGWSDCCLSSYVLHPSGPGVCCVKRTPGAQFGVI